ncbi:MAG: GTPase HflX [Chloroflexi bacterium]|nr:GTPase HflX [Chloroflexota bacterium]MCI0828003.1 GTPase HflX [Chloroflexota bacterium]MCI0876832.1 GTPase HflX [Chloroflexota bacterium]MCI0893186.1 GTPase HflX [Chloroflexota bacterium]
MGKHALPTGGPRERALLVGVELRGTDSILSLDSSLKELALLADSAGLSVVGESRQRLQKPDPKTYVGSGKVKEIRALAEETLADVVLFDEELSPRHQRELEKEFDEEVRVLDRTALILDVFAQHARTREGALQVELAQYEYRLPRLTRAWTHLARQAGGGAGRTGAAGGVGLRGPGETQLEVDKREISRRIHHLKGEIEKLRAHRGRYRSRRRHSQIPIVALVGYTNAGKSTLLNQLTDGGVFVANQLFATLDPTTRRAELPGGKAILVTDTVGFIQKLPTTLVAAFQATLEEISEADLLLHVIDISHADAAAQARSVIETLRDIGADTLPLLTAANKIDVLPNGKPAFPEAVPISALTGEGMPELLAAIENELYIVMVPVRVQLPYEQGRLISMFHEHGLVELEQHVDGVVKMEGRLPRRLTWAFKPYREDLEESALG